MVMNRDKRLGILWDKPQMRARFDFYMVSNVYVNCDKTKITEILYVMPYRLILNQICYV